MSQDGDDSRRESVIGKRPNDSPGYGKKIPKSKASDEHPAGTGRHLSLEAKAIIFEIFEKFKRGELKVLSNAARGVHRLHTHSHCTRSRKLD